VGEYQAQKIRSYNTTLTSDLMKVLPVTDKAAMQKILDGYREHQAKWNDETSKEFDEAKDLEKDVEKAEARPDASIWARYCSRLAL